MTTLTMLDESTIKDMQGIIQLTLDSSRGCTEAASQIDDERIADILRTIAGQRQAQAMELQSYVKDSGTDPEDAGTVMGMLHRCWINFRGSLNGGSPLVVLVEVERGEQELKSRYEEILRKPMPADLLGVLHQHLMALREVGEGLAALRQIVTEK